MSIFKTYCPSSANTPAHIREEQPADLADQSVESGGGFASVGRESYSVKWISRKTQFLNFHWMHEEEDKYEFYFLLFE